jgi:hypothetical protein
MTEIGAADLARIIRSKLRDGTLPREGPARLNVAVGGDDACAACEKPIVSSETEYVAHYRDVQRALIRLHLRCYRLWDAERTRQE